MTGKIYVSGADKDWGLVTQLTFDFSNDPQVEPSPYAKLKRGNPVPQDQLPEYMYVGSGGPTYKKLRHVFNAGGIICVDEVTADVLRQHDLGDGRLQPVEMLQKDRRTPIAGNYFILIYGNIKRVFMPEKSGDIKELKPNVYGHDLYSGGGSLYDNRIAVSNKALEGPDIWVDDRLTMVFFISEKLARALKKAKLYRAFRLFECKVIGE